MMAVLYFLLVVTVLLGSVCCLLVLVSAILGMWPWSLLFGFGAAVCLFWTAVISREIDDMDGGDGKGGSYA